MTNIGGITARQPDIQMASAGSDAIGISKFIPDSRFRPLAGDIEQSPIASCLKGDRVVVVLRLPIPDPATTLLAV